MNLIKSDYFNTFRHKFLIVIYNIELKVICKEEKTKGEREKNKLSVMNISVILHYF